MPKFVQRILSDRTALTLVLGNLVIIALSRTGMAGTAPLKVAAFFANVPARIGACAIDFDALDPRGYPLTVLLFVILQWLAIGNLASFAAKRIARTQSRL